MSALGQQEEPGRGGGEARRHRGADAGVGHHMAADVDAGRERDGEREEGEPGLEGTRSEDVLHVERGEQEQAEQRGRCGEHHREPAADAAVGEAVDAQQRVVVWRSARTNATSPAMPGPRAETSADVQPALGGLRERVHERAEPGRWRAAAPAKVESAPARRGGVRG